MKRLIMLAIFFIAIGGVNAATTVDMNWNGGGNFNTHFAAGDDATADFWTSGGLISGEFHATDSDNNPYNYGVDNVEAKFKAHAENGFIEYKFDRLDAKTSYGDAGQRSYSMVGSSGTADLSWRSTSNYASLSSSNYGWQANGQMQATGNHEITHTFGTSTEWAGMHIVADGTSYVSDMSEGSNKNGYTFGKGLGCYTNAEVDIVGAGVFDLDAYADNSIVTDTGITTDGYLNIHSNFGSGFHYDNFALTGN